MRQGLLPWKEGGDWKPWKIRNRPRMAEMDSRPWGYRGKIYEIAGDQIFIHVICGQNPGPGKAPQSEITQYLTLSRDMRGPNSPSACSQKARPRR